MKLSELPINTQVTIEMTLGGKVYPMASSVIFNDVRGTLLAPITSQGKLLPLGQGVFANATYRIFATGQTENGREAWSSVALTTLATKKGYVYKADVSTFNSQSLNANRRGNVRYPVGVMGYYAPATSGVNFEAKIEDISVNGIAISLQEDLPLVDSHMQIEFSEELLGDLYEVHIGVTCVRKMEKNHRFLYGCSIETAQKEFLIYLAAKQESMLPQEERKSLKEEAAPEPEPEKPAKKQSAYHFIGRK